MQLLLVALWRRDTAGGNVRGFTPRYSHKCWPISLWREVTVTSGANTCDRDCRYSAKYKRKKKMTQKCPTFSLDQLCHSGVCQRERYCHISIRKRQRINQEDLKKMHATNIYLATVWFSLSSVYVSAGNGYNSNRAKGWPPSSPFYDKAWLNHCGPLTAPTVCLQQAHLFNLCLSFIA